MPSEPTYTDTPASVAMEDLTSSPLQQPLPIMGAITGPESPSRPPPVAALGEANTSAPPGAHGNISGFSTGAGPDGYGPSYAPAAYGDAITGPESPSRPPPVATVGEANAAAPPGPHGSMSGFPPGSGPGGYGPSYAPAAYGGYPMHPYQMAGMNPAAYQYAYGRPPYPYPPGYGGHGAHGAEPGSFPAQQQRKPSSPGRSSRGGHSTGSTSPRRGVPGAKGKSKAGITAKEDKKVENKEIERLRAAAETELNQMDVKPIQTDFHFFVMEKKDTYKKDAEKEVQDTNKGKLDAYLVNSNLNCRLMKAWEDLGVAERDGYTKKEQADRRRFMQDDEVASRHCATLTARARSPDKKDPDDSKRASGGNEKTESPTKKNKTEQEAGESAGV